MCNFELNERDLSTLSYLVNGLVHSPGKAKELTTFVLDLKPDPPLKAAVEAVRTRFLEKFPSGNSQRNERLIEDLRTIVTDLQNESDAPVRRTGNLLAVAVENLAVHTAHELQE